jgi:hypothetical protein
MQPPVEVLRGMLLTPLLRLGDKIYNTIRTDTLVQNALAARLRVHYLDGENRQTRQLELDNHTASLTALRYYYASVYEVERDRRFRRFQLNKLLRDYNQARHTTMAQQYLPTILRRERAFLPMVASFEITPPHDLQGIRVIMNEITGWLADAPKAPNHIPVETVEQARVRLARVIAETEYERGLAIFESQHPRLGAASPLNTLDPDVLNRIHALSLNLPP